MAIKKRTKKRTKKRGRNTNYDRRIKIESENRVLQKAGTERRTLSFDEYDEDARIANCRDEEE